MRTLFLRQRVLDRKERESIWDEERNDCYWLVGRLFNAGSKISLLDRAEQEQFYVEEAFFALLSTFTIYCGEEQFAQVRQKLTLGRPKLTITATEHRFAIEGNIWGVSVNLIRDGVHIATLQKQWADWCENYYALSVLNASDEPEALALTIAIDRFIHGGGG